LVVLEHEEYKGKPRFLYGDSMGGSVCLLLHRRDPSFWDGTILVAPMCKVCARDMDIHLKSYFSLHFHHTMFNKM